jgi:peptidoglycan/LPS O-acetylase OafA/YrhL
MKNLRDLGKAGEYIEHIDGLRFAAVSLVLLYHADTPGISGGYIGVDMFFVISGFLISRILSKKSLDRRAIIRFYTSRFRRIVPAYLALVATTGIVASFIFLPVHLDMLLPGLVSCIAFMSNIVFYRATSYFSPDLAYNPLLHTWSLAVEWQFYMVYPFIFIAFRRLKVRDLTTIALMSVTSFALCVILLAFYKLEAAFYLLPTRMWEFGVGGLIALAPARKLPPVLSRLLAAGAVGAIAFCVIHYDKNTLFPGAAALAPCIATAILIRECGDAGPLHWLLTLSPVRMMGQASYSIYLWHWPIIVFLDYGFFHFTSNAFVYRAVTIVVLSTALGLASWRLVELPFRRPAALRGTRLGWISGLALVPLLTAFTIAATDGMPRRFTGEVTLVSSGSRDVGTFRSCMTHTASIDGSTGGLCKLGASAARRTFLLLGDSHAAALAEGISDLAERDGKAGLLSVADACLPFLSYPSSYTPARGRCELSQKAIPAMLATLKPNTVILHATWPAYYQANPQAFKAALTATLDWLATQKVRVYLIGDTPGASANVPIGLAKKIAYHTPFDLVRTADYESTHQAVDALLRTEARAHGFVYLDTASALCARNGYCEVELNDHALYWDAAHLSGYGSRLVAGNLARSGGIEF